MQYVARTPPGAEEVLKLEREVELLKQAIQLCDEMPCHGDKWRRKREKKEAAERAAAELAAQQEAGAVAAQSADAEASAMPLPASAEAVQQGDEQQQQGQELALEQGAIAAGISEDCIVVPDTQEAGMLSLPQPAAEAAADVIGTAHAPPDQQAEQLADDAQQQQQQPEQPPVVVGGAAQDADEEEEGGRSRMSGAWQSRAVGPASSSGVNWLHVNRLLPLLP